MNKEYKEYNFLKELNSFLDGKLWDYKRKVELLQDVVEVKQDLLDTISMVLPNETERIITKSKKEDYVGKQMKLLEHQQSQLRKKVNGILNPKTKIYRKPEVETKRLIIDNKTGRVLGE